MDMFPEIGFAGMVPYGQGCVTQIGKYVKYEGIFVTLCEIFNIQSSHFDPFCQYHLH